MIILRRVTRSFPARQKARRASVEPLVTNSAAVQSSWSTRRSYFPTRSLSCQLMCTFWPAFVPLAPLLPKIITHKCLFRSQHLAMCPSMLFHKQPRSRGLLRDAPRSTESRRTSVSRQRESQISNNFGTLLNHRRGITRTRSSATVNGKTTTEALQLLTTFGAGPSQVPDLRTLR